MGLTPVMGYSCFAIDHEGRGRTATDNRWFLEAGCGSTAREVHGAISLRSLAVGTPRTCVLRAGGAKGCLHLKKCVYILPFAQARQDDLDVVERRSMEQDRNRSDARVED